MTALLHRGDTPTAGHHVTTAPSALRVDLEARGPTCRLTLRGRAVRHLAGRREAPVDQLGCKPCETVDIDMRHVTRLDEVGANVLSASINHYVLGRGGELRVTAPTRDVA